MVDVRMDATVRHEAQEMDASPALARPPKGAEQRVVREERAVLDRDVDAHQVLEEDATRSDREVPDLRVAHLARRQPDGLARRLQCGMRVLLPEPVEDGCLGELDAFPGPGGARPQPSRMTSATSGVTRRQLRRRRRRSRRTPARRARRRLPVRRPRPAAPGAHARCPRSRILRRAPASAGAT